MIIETFAVGMLACAAGDGAPLGYYEGAFRDFRLGEP